jgi:predicted glycogen debranching enzyme
MRELRDDAALFESRAPRADAGAEAGNAAGARCGPSPWPSVAVNGELARARREWLHTNGAGAYASSTLAGMHTRRYHGLLVAALDPPRGRHVFLSHVDATLMRPRGSGGLAGGAAPSSRPGSRPSWELGKHQFPGVNPEGGKPLYLQRFDQDPLPRWTYAAAGGELEVTLALVRGENALVLRYQWRGPHPVDLSLRPLIAARNFHNLQREHGGMLQRVELRPPAPDSNPGRTSERAPRPSTPPPSQPSPRKHGEMRVQPRRELPRLCFRYEGTFVGSPDWWRRFEYLAEHERGLDFEEDLWTPGVFEVPLDEHPSWLVAGVERLPDGEPEELLEQAKGALLAEDPGARMALPARRLHIAAESFRADLARKPGVLAGYPWFEVWGRDALMALPGLYLVQKNVDGAVRVLRELIATMADGLVPNRFPEPAGPPAGSAVPAAGVAQAAGAPDYGCADATLWLFEAVRLVADALGDDAPVVVGELLPALRDAFEATLRGTRNGVHLTADGLFAAGKPGDAVTWMAARVKGRAVTSRAGCPIELSALWARGCDTLARLALAAGDPALAAAAAGARDRARAAFHERFWCDDTGYPYDVVSETLDGDGAFRDPAIRPNAVLALAIDPACFTAPRARLLLDRARRDLVTPAGLRTLAPGDPRYVGRYAGGVEARDGAYHQGAVWPWLLGFYARAALRAGTEDRVAIEQLVTAAARTELGFGMVSELADGDAPHHPAGSVAHAVSVAELLRVLAWDVPGGDVPGGDVPGGDVPGGDVPGGDVPGGDVRGGDVPRAG